MLEFRFAAAGEFARRSTADHTVGVEGGRESAGQPRKPSSSARACRPFFIGLLGERYGWVPGDPCQKIRSCI